MRKNILGAMLALVLLGAGCSSGQTTETQQPTPAPAPSPVTTTTAATTTTSTIPTPATTSTSMSDTLAFPGVLPVSEINKKVLIKTTLGNIEIQLDPKAGPNAASNFVYLVKHKFYDGLIFHRVIPGFMIQGGDPKGNGTGGPGYTIPDEPVSGPSAYSKGAVAMARTQMPNSAGSQFFIMVDSVPLTPATYVVFGHVISGQDVADKISAVETTINDSGEKSEPVQEVKMLSVTIE